MLNKTHLEAVNADRKSHVTLKDNKTWHNDGNVVIRYLQISQ